MMEKVNTVSEMLVEAANALDNADMDRLSDLREQLSNWLVGDDERNALDAALSSMMASLDR